MVTVVGSISVLAYSITLITLKNKWIQQQMLFLGIYLIGLTIVGELDVLLPIYFVFSLLPFIRKIKKISYSTAFISLFFIVYLVIGFSNQNITGTIVSFIAKFWQFIVFFIVYDSDILIGDEDYKKIIKFAVVIETILGIYLLINSTNIDANGYARLVSNSQPITGNISTVVLPVVVYYYLKNKQNPNRISWLIIMSVIMLVWIVLSGTRGYSLEFAATMVLIVYDYYFNKNVGEVVKRNRIIGISFLILIVIVCLIIDPDLVEDFERILRIKSSVGIRTYENAAVIDYIKNTSLLALLFGLGLGCQGGHIAAMRSSLYKQFNLGMWNYNHYLEDYGALFHNLYANAIMCLGIIGIIILVYIIVGIWRRITLSCGNNNLARKILHLYLLSFLIMNYYRWSAVCGISEMIVFAIILKLLEADERQGVEN